MNLLEDLDRMPADLKALYQLRGDFTRTLANFRTWRGVWKASLLNDAEDEQAADIAQACWQQLRSLRKKITAMHAELGFSKIENAAFELPREEYDEKIAPEVTAPTVAKMPDDIKRMLASVLEDDWSEQ